MTDRERRRLYSLGATEEVDMCLNCVHFHRHYTRKLIEGVTRFTVTAWGHCDYPRIKIRKPYQLCEEYESRADNDGS